MFNLYNLNFVNLCKGLIRLFIFLLWIDWKDYAIGNEPPSMVNLSAISFNCSKYAKFKWSNLNKWLEFLFLLDFPIKVVDFCCVSFDLFCFFNSQKNLLYHNSMIFISYLTQLSQLPPVFINIKSALTCHWNCGSSNHEISLVLYTSFFKNKALLHMTHTHIHICACVYFI